MVEHCDTTWSLLYLLFPALVCFIETLGQMPRLSFFALHATINIWPEMGYLNILITLVWRGTVDT